MFTSDIRCCLSFNYMTLYCLYKSGEGRYREGLVRQLNFFLEFHVYFSILLDLNKCIHVAFSLTFQLIFVLENSHWKQLYTLLVNTYTCILQPVSSQEQQNQFESSQQNTIWIELQTDYLYSCNCLLIISYQS